MSRWTRPARMDVREPGQRRRSPAGHVAGVGRAAADPLGEASAVDEFLHEERAPGPLVTRRNDALGDEGDDRGVIQRRQDARLGVDPFRLPRLGALGDLDGDGPAVREVRPAEHRGGGAPAQSSWTRKRPAGASGRASTLASSPAAANWTGRPDRRSGGGPFRQGCR